MIYKEINGIMYSDWEDDGQFDKVLVVKAKNYVLVEGDKVKVKGSSLTDSKKEPALLELLNKLITDLLDHKGANVKDLYERYIKEANQMEDDTRWATKKSIKDKVLNPQRTNEQKVLDAVKHLNPREGDKFYVYTAIDGEKQDVKKGEPVFNKKGEPKMVKNSILKVVEEFANDEDTEHYTKRVYMTLDILKNVVDMEQIIKYHLKGNSGKLEELLAKI